MQNNYSFLLQKNQYYYIHIYMLIYFSFMWQSDKYGYDARFQNQPEKLTAGFIWRRQYLTLENILQSFLMKKRVWHETNPLHIPQNGYSAV